MRFFSKIEKLFIELVEPIAQTLENLTQLETKQNDGIEMLAKRLVSVENENKALKEQITAMSDKLNEALAKPKKPSKKSTMTVKAEAPIEPIFNLDGSANTNAVAVEAKTPKKILRKITDEEYELIKKCVTESKTPTQVQGVLMRDLGSKRATSTLHSVMKKIKKELAITKNPAGKRNRKSIVWNEAMDEAITLGFFRGLSNEEIAPRVGKTADAVRNRRSKLGLSKDKFKKEFERLRNWDGTRNNKNWTKEEREDLQRYKNECNFNVNIISTILSRTPDAVKRELARQEAAKGTV